MIIWNQSSRYGPGDPFASLPIVSVATLKPGDLIVRCSSAFSSQMTEMMIWSRYTHVALYIGNGKIIDSTWQHGVKTRPLADLLHESNRVGVLRLEGLTSAQEQALVSAAQSKEGSEYNFPAVKTLGTQKLAALTNVPQESPAGMIDILSRAEQLPPDTVDNGRFACSQLVAFALKAVNTTLSHANGLTPGDMVRLGQTGLLTKVGRLIVPSSSPTDANHSDTN